MCDDDEDEDVPWGDGLSPLRDWPTLEVEMEPRAVVGRLFGVDGTELVRLYDRPSVPFGFQVP